MKDWGAIVFCGTLLGIPVLMWLLGWALAVTA